MLSALLGEGDELSPLKRLIAEGTGGNPFFIEEIVQGLSEDGALVANGMVRITRSLSQLRLLPTVQGMLAARVDRLPRPQKDIADAGSYGAEGAPTAGAKGHICRRSAAEPKFGGIVSAAEFIYEQPVASDTEFVFKHALTQEVSYSSLFIERRKELHECVGFSI